MTSRDEPDMKIEAAGAGLGALAGVAVGGPLGGVVGAAVTPYLVELVGRSWNELRGRKERNATQVVVMASEYAGVDPENLIRGALDGEDSSRLLDLTLQAGATIADERKIQALARCLANGVEDAARIDQETLVVRALTDLDPVHVRVLAELYRHGRSQRDVHVFLTGEVTPREFVNSNDLSGAVLAVLERHGAVERKETLRPDRGGVYSRGPTVDGTYEATEFGRLCLDRLGYKVRKRPKI